MSTVYHILNGDALKERFPASIDGTLIVARECLVDGDVGGKTLTEFFENRAQFISESYGDYSTEDYKEETISEFEKILSLPTEAAVYLWFEDDLFCQVNLWFVAFLLVNHTTINTAYLVRPLTHNHYGFGGLSEQELIEIYKYPLVLRDLSEIAQLWIHYQSANSEALLSTAENLQETYPFILRAVKAHIERIPNENSPGRPEQSLIDIMSELGTNSFGAVFQEFNKRESIYGFGDLQVKRMYDEIVKGER